MTSPFAIRGVIEGFYGNPWTQAQRLDCIRFIGARGMNTFVYGPKDDPLVRRRWREPYDDEALASLREVVATGAEAGVEIMYAISPGLSIRYSSAEDRAVLLAKLEQVAALGVSRFALLLDDLPPELAHDEDRAVYADIAEAHGALSSAVAADLGPDRQLVVCPLVYHGRGDEPYLARLAAALDPAVDLMWTGRDICSPILETDDARRFEATAARPPLYWETTRSTTSRWAGSSTSGRTAVETRTSTRRRAASSPTRWSSRRRRRSPSPRSRTTSPTPRATTPRRASRRAIRDVAGDGSADGGRDAQAFATFAENVRSSCLGDEDAPTVTAALATFGAAADDAAETGDARALTEAAANLRALAEQQLAAADHLLRGQVAKPALVDECRPWIEAFEVGARAMCRAADLALEGSLPRDLATVTSALLPFHAELRRRRVRVFGDALDMFLADTTDTHTRPGRLLPVEGGELR